MDYFVLNKQFCSKRYTVAFIVVSDVYEQLVHYVQKMSQISLKKVPEPRSSS